MGYLKERRKTEITITSSIHHSLIGNKYIFDSKGELSMDFGSITPDWLIAEMKKYVGQAPLISGTDVVEFHSLDNGEVAATALAERYIDITLGQILDINQKRYPDKIAVVDAQTGQRLTFKELCESSNHLARHLMDLGVAKGDTVAVVMTNCVDQFIAKYGIIKTGAVIVNISPYEREQGFETLLRQTDARVVIVKDEAHIQMLNNICPEIASAKDGIFSSERLPVLRTVLVAGNRNPSGMLNMGELLGTVASTTYQLLEERQQSISHRDVATIIHTSGTTGSPKSVMLKHGAVAENASEHVKMLGVTGYDTFFMPIPMFHALGCVGTVCTGLICGATIVCAHRPKAPDVLRILSEEKCTVMFAVPSLYITMAEHVKETGFDTGEMCLRLAVMAGAVCTEQNINDTHNVLGVKDVLVMYGMTECGPGVSSTRLEDSIEIQTQTVGRPWAGETVKLVNTYINDEGIECGELCVRGYNVMKGFYKDKQSTEKAIDIDGWLHTGDVCNIREDGNIVICGRTKDIIIRSGENISPREVEEFLITMPGILEAVAVGAKDYKYGEVVYAYVRTEGDIPDITQAVTDFCRGKIATIKIPVKTIALDDFPRSDTGKILRRTLREMATEDHKK